jgi:hypothetical protein
LSVTTEIDFAEGYRPGVIGRIAQMHAVYYAREWGFGAFLEAKIAGEAASFMERYDPATDLLLLAMSGDAIAGSIIVDLNDTASKDVEGSDRGAHEDFGFRLAQQRQDNTWGDPVHEQLYLRG